MENLIGAYLPLVVFFLLCLTIGLALLLAPFFLAPSAPDSQKNAPYECGFEPFDNARMPFDIRFYLVAILFIVFDLEVALLFPWALAFDLVGLSGFIATLIFLTLLTVGFVYEWRSGALEWA